MYWASIFMIGLASNLDNLGIGVSYGVRSIKLPLLSNALIAVISMVALFVSMMAGQWVTAILPNYFANIGGAVLLILIGLKELIKKNPKPASSSPIGELNGVLLDPARADLDQNQVISLRESLVLGSALALNCLATGIGAGASGLNPYWTTLSVGLFSMLTIEIGLRAGVRISSTWVGKYSELISGLLLIFIGIGELFN